MQNDSRPDVSLFRYFGLRRTTDRSIANFIQRTEKYNTVKTCLKSVPSKCRSTTDNNGDINADIPTHLSAMSLTFAVIVLGVVHWSQYEANTKPMNAYHLTWNIDVEPYNTTVDVTGKDVGQGYAASHSQLPTILAGSSLHPEGV
ncbi:unnamed protein product [Aspergillus oryzae var. brunneus]|uniref:Unnamed protein product n=2 Tax=Aspergillus oryzae TaxID=5062 RepID=A0AAN4YJS7_ASPOZ|nr:unnamed protein product [Aspergillus oryzae]GMG43463.1 unnamed protein product [Aspergillus oryzae var. brunneus]